ncbi:hypothetical protein GCM10018784_65580 [Streptomyces hydrogenans]|nr:hypothetical protein GCM10018784_65580 [Streptomyces hydrogenans]
MDGEQPEHLPRLAGGGKQGTASLRGLECPQKPDVHSGLLPVITNLTLQDSPSGGPDDSAQDTGLM